VDAPSAPRTFIVRITLDPAGGATGVVEQVRRVGRSVADISRVIAAMVRGEHAGGNAAGDALKHAEPGDIVRISGTCTEQVVITTSR